MPSPRDSTKRTRWDPSNAGPRVWFVGPWSAAEFAGTRPAIIGGEARDLATLDAAVAALADGAIPPEVVLLAQLRPNFWPQSAVDAFQASAPLARIVIVAGTWCEGEPRTGRPLAGAVRLYWHELPAWWRQSLARREAGLAPHWSQWGNRVREVTTADRRSADALASQTIAIDAPDFAVLETIAAALRAYGASCQWTPRGRGKIAGAAAGIFDGSQLDIAEAAELCRFCERFDGRAAPVIVLLDFPRPEHLAAIRDAGALTLLGKPYSIAALADELAGGGEDRNSLDSPVPSLRRGKNRNDS